MMFIRLSSKLFAVALLLSSVACSGLPSVTTSADVAPLIVAVPQDETLLARYAPVFILEEADKRYNLIGTPTIRDAGKNRPEAYVDPQRPVIYSQQQTFTSNGRDYTNLIYRVHFEKTPLPHLTAGNNVGLLVIVTLDAQFLPQLLTTVHTCGCYLAIIPTTYLAEATYPPNWSRQSQSVYGESLPGVIDVTQFDARTDRFAFRLRSGTHRVMAVELLTSPLRASGPDLLFTSLRPMAELRRLPYGNASLSLFETEGPRKGYVRNSHKPLERWLMSWWAFDWRIGEDKDLGPAEKTGTIFYTSLKIWARKDSDLWEFTDFLNYWGWDL